MRSCWACEADGVPPGVLLLDWGVRLGVVMVGTVGVVAVVVAPVIPLVTCPSTPGRLVLPGVLTPGRPDPEDPLELPEVAPEVLVEFLAFAFALVLGGFVVSSDAGQAAAVVLGPGSPGIDPPGSGTHPFGLEGSGSFTPGWLVPYQE